MVLPSAGPPTATPDTSSVAEVMQTPQVTVGPDTPIVEAAGRLAEEEIDSLVVTDRESPVGVLTEADVVGLIASSGDRSTPVADVMSAQGISVEADESIEDAAGTLREADVPTLPVRDREGCLAGVLTVMELADVESATAGPAGGQDEPSTQRRSSRPDTAYERADWEFDGSGEGEATLAVGDVVTFDKPVTEGDVAAFAEASGDTNRLHLEEEFAARTRFGRRIVHGTLLAGLISAALTRPLAPPSTSPRRSPTVAPSTSGTAPRHGVRW